MNCYIKNIKIFNFLSFFGKNEVEVQPFTTIINDYDKGRNDFFKAIEFIFGKDLSDLGFQETAELINPAFLTFEKEPAGEMCYVEVTLHLIRKKADLVMKRTVENWEMKYYINGRCQSELNYTKHLELLNLHDHQKNVIFYKEHFVQAIYGSNEDLEEVITTILRGPLLLADLKKSEDKIKRLEELQELLTNKDYFSNSSYEIISEFVEIYESVSEKRETRKEKMLQEIFNTLDEEDSPATSPELEDSRDELLRIESGRKLQMVSELEAQENTEREKFQEALKEKNLLTSNLYHDKIKLAKDPNNAHIILEQIQQLKTQLRVKENELSSLRRKLDETQEQLELISNEISYEKVKIKEIQDAKSLQIRLTSYGRFADHINFSPLLDIFKEVVGENIFYGNLCDSREEAEDYLEYIYENKIERREHFIIFEDYSHKLKDLILCSDENGINIDDVEKLQIFLIKLKKYELISSVPILLDKEFNFQPNWAERNNDVIYVKSRTYITSDNIITQKCKDEAAFEEEDRMISYFNKLQTYQEMEYHHVNDLHCRKWAVLTEMNELKQDILYLKRNIKKSPPEREPADEIIFVSPILYYGDDDGFKEIFEEEDKRWEELMKELAIEIQEIEKAAGVILAPVQRKNPEIPPSSYTELEERSEKVELLQSDLKVKKDSLDSREKELRQSFASSICLQQIPRTSWIASQNPKDKSAMYFDREFAKLKKSMTEDDVNFFLANEEFRQSFLEALHDNIDHLRFQIELAWTAHEDLSGNREKKLISLTEFCSNHLFYTFQHMLDNVIPFVDLVFNRSETNLRLVTSLGDNDGGAIRVVDFEHLNTLLKFIVVLSVFLQITKFEKTPIMVLDDMDKFFPMDKLDAVLLDPENLNRLLPETQQTCYDLKMRIGDYLKYFNKTNIPRTPQKVPLNKTEIVEGPCQIIFFSSGELSLVGDSTLLLGRELLPDEYNSNQHVFTSTLNAFHFD